jgi:hypothetical protein
MQEGMKKKLKIWGIDRIRKYMEPQCHFVQYKFHMT